MGARRGRERLVAILCLAYSGEKAAAHAYRGHANSVRDPQERLRIREIEEEEWHHRRLVGGMLRDLGSSPGRGREAWAAAIGRLLGAACHISGWLAPMYGAGRLERRNIGEYEEAARLARECGRGDLVDCLLTMAEVEWEHERYFRERVLSHRLGRCLPIWAAPPPKREIRDRFGGGGVPVPGAPECLDRDVSRGVSPRYTDQAHGP